MKSQSGPVRHFVSACMLMFLASAVAEACSAGNIRGSQARGTNSGGGAGTFSLNTGGNFSLSSGGLDGMGGSQFKACMQASDCAATELCVDGTCRPTTGACTADKDCLGDARCCGAGCRTDGKTDGVCVPNDGVDNTCKKDSVALGVFSPSLQCKWAGPAADDPYFSHSRVMATPLVADLPNDSGAAAEIIIVTSDEGEGAAMGDTVYDPRTDPKTGMYTNPRANQPATGGVIRILNGQTCAQEEVIPFYVRGPAAPAIADLDGDGKLEIVTRTQHWENSTDNGTQLIAFTWDDATKKFKQYWISDSGLPGVSSNAGWDGVSIHDLDNDGKPEVIARYGAVFNGQTGHMLAAPNMNLAVLADPVLGDVDADGEVELVANKVFKWTGAGWADDHPGPNAPANAAPEFYAFADFGTPGATPADFNFKQKDGKAEIVTTGSTGGSDTGGQVAIYTLEGQQILKVDLPSGERGGPPTIGDFDHDGFPEIASAGATAFRVFDPDCKAGGPGCVAPYIRWSQPSKDQSSARTGSVIFDFEGDGQAEAVYADECFLRVYKGDTGEVEFSAFRSSCTWLENPVVADPDRDTRTEIVVNSNLNCNVDCPEVDPIDNGVRCDKNEDCVSKACGAGFCRCKTDLDCGNTFMPNPAQPSVQPEGLGCRAPLDGSDATGNVCRALHPNSQSADQKMSWNALYVYRDVLDRWADSRPLWNQHAYSITNINDNGTIPATKDWKQNFLDPKLNNYRANRQGDKSANLLPDITGALTLGDVCHTSGDKVVLAGKVCNRGLRVVGANMPATFYNGPPADGKVLCVSYTSGPVQLGNACLPVSCELPAQDVVGSDVYMVVNDDGQGHATTEECNTDNNTDKIAISECPVVK
jgi:hypothetical protein